MGNLDEKMMNTEECKVIITGKLPEIVRIGATVTKIMPRQEITKIGSKKEPISTTFLGMVGPDGEREALDENGIKAIENTLTTEQQRKLEADEKKRIAEMPSPDYDSDADMPSQKDDSGER